MGLLVGHHLQAVLDPAQKIVRRRQFVARRRVDPAVGGERGERGDSAAAAQIVMPATGDELLGLGEKFDLADAAAAELDIVAFDRDLAMAAIGVNLPLHFVNVGNGRVVEIFAPDKRREIAQQLLAGGKIAGTSARLDQGGAFPVLAAAFVIIERRLRRNRDLGRRRIGAQPQIDAKDIAVRGALLQKFHQVARQAHIERSRLGAAAEFSRGGIEEDHEVDVAGKIKLAASHLAHGEHDIAGTGFGVLPIRRNEFFARDRLAQEKVDGGANRGVGEIGERAGDARDRPDAADIGKRDDERGFGLHAAENAHHVVERRRRGGRGFCSFQQSGKRRIRMAVDQAQKARSVGFNEVPQIGRRFGDAAEKIRQAVDGRE